MKLKSLSKNRTSSKPPQSYKLFIFILYNI